MIPIGFTSDEVLGCTIFQMILIDEGAAKPRNKNPLSTEKNIPGALYSYHRNAGNQTPRMTSLCMTGADAAASSIMSAHLLKLTTELDSTSSSDFLHGVVELLVRPSGEAALQAQSTRSRNQDDLAMSSENIIIEVARRNLSEEQIMNDFVNVGADANVAKALAATLYTIVDDRRIEIDRALAKKTTLISAGTLEDFDWSLRLVMGSDQLSTLRQPLLLLSLTIRNTNGEIEHKTLELDQERLNTMLETFDNISDVISTLV